MRHECFSKTQRGRLRRETRRFVRWQLHRTGDREWKPLKSFHEQPHLSWPQAISKRTAFANAKPSQHLLYAAGTLLPYVVEQRLPITPLDILRGWLRANRAGTHTTPYSGKSLERLLSNSTTSTTPTPR